mgnify:CR=1 FL=1
MLKISEATALALHTAGLLAAHPHERIPTRDIAAFFDISETHLAKVMQRLVKFGIVKSVRGPGGGFTLKKPASEISLMDIYSAIEGPFNPQRCLLGHDVCPIPRCLLGDFLASTNRRVRDYLLKTKLTESASVFRHNNFSKSKIMKKKGTL